MSSAAALTWFARHELRLAWREWLAMMTGGRRGRKRRAVIGLIAFAAIMHLPAYAVIGRFADLQAPLDKPSLIVITATIVLAWALMLSQAIESVTRVFYARADLDLIMSSPVRLANVFSVRIAAIAVGDCDGAVVVDAFCRRPRDRRRYQMARGLWRRHRDRIISRGGCDRGHGSAVSIDRPEPDPANRANSFPYYRRRLCDPPADRRHFVLWHAVAVRDPDFGCRSRLCT